MSKQVLLEIKNLVTEFRTEKETVKAINGISFTLSCGETIGIVGESGSGKSVTALSIMRLIASSNGKISGGEILYHSKNKGVKDIIKLSQKEMSSIRGKEMAMVFQEPMTSLNPVYTCGNQVMESILLHHHVSKKEAKEMTINLFIEVQFADPLTIFNHYPHQLSGGQKQRVMIAMAMAGNPRVLIADEPTTALDVTVQATILELMLKLQREYDMGILFVAHDLGVIAELADKVLVMYKGEIVEHGSVLDVFSNPKHPYTKGLLACRPPLDKRISLLPTVSHFMKFDAKGLAVLGQQSVGEVTDSYIISSEDRAKAHKVLYGKAPILQIKNLKTYFPINNGIFGQKTDFVKAIDDVSFDVYPGETLGLVGESGCGKTTLGRTILRLIRPTAGEIIFDGKNICEFSEKEMLALRRDIQIIFQDPYSSLNPRKIIGQAIMEPMQVHGIGLGDKERKEMVIDILNSVNLEESHFYRYPHEFSGGQRQRICIARALALRPKFIICDEPVSALDVSVQAQVLNLLNELKRKFEFTYIFISHDLSVVKFMSDRMIVMNKGKIEEHGDPDSIYNNPQTEYTKKLINAIPKGRLEDIKAAINKKLMLK